MIKLGSPIGFTNKSIINKSYEGFHNRINDNYKLMRANISSEDLLHAFTQAPEVFLAEGDTTNIFNSSVNVTNTQKQKLEILNSLINRILIMDGNNFSYQDSVYISSVLHKLGIKDEQTFINQIQNLIDETKLTFEQNKTLSESINEIKKISGIVNTTNVRNINSDSGNADGNKETNFYLHQNILEKIGFSELVNYVNQITTRPFTEKIIRRKDIIGAENLRISEHLSLQELRNEITHENVPMVFNHENLYEENLEAYEEINESEVKNNLIKAMLISYIDNLYQARSADIINNNNVWYESVNELYLSVDNTVKRYTENMVNPINSTLINEFHDDEIKNYSSLQNNLTYVINQLESIEEGDVLSTSQTTNILNTANVNEGKIEQINNLIKANTENTVNNPVSMTNLEVNNNTDVSEEEVLIEQLKRIEQHNIENQNQYIRAMQTLKELSNEPKRVAGNKGRQREESLKALDNPETLIHMYQEEQIKDISDDAIHQRQMIDSLPEDVRKYVDIIDRYLIHPTDKTRAALSVDPIALLQKDIAEVENRKEKLRHIVRENTENVVSEEVANQLIESITNNSVVNRQIDETVTENVSRMAFVHKENVYIDEEEIQERFDQLKKETVENKIITNQVNETTQVINKTEVTKEVIENVVQSEQVLKMVAQNVSDQLNTLSDQVYSKLEKRLTNEKRRRGL